MPESKPRKKKTVAPRPVDAPAAKPKESPRWLAPLMVGLMVLGLAWIVTFYLTSSGLGLPVPQLGQWNLAIGFGLIIVGFGLTTRWR
ncbi:cell division protein CrgA [Myceligenerans indicum]|uniref:Cell division protein CrgA n=1 Tax=Myceligenerans indicum TaxID=2593663 RepID=A0ABS1LRG1_9MICO|nr:cell division protein CrgA [Myceligenerans indicum]MBL0888758.1 cell division protein CrgA [Myceligenerans indicum]